MNNKNKDKVRLKNAGAFFLTPCYRTPAASGLTHLIVFLFFQNSKEGTLR